MITISQFKPRSKLEVPQTLMEKSKYPVIDAHNHLGEVKDVKALLENMDRFNIKMMVDLDGLYGEPLDHQLKTFVQPYPDRFTVFCRINLENIDDPDFGIKTEKYIRECAKKGVKGVKFIKYLGLVYKDQSGKFILPDDPRLKPVWDTAAELKLPVTIHIGDPIAFFEPINEYNERYEELHEHPDWSFYNTGSPDFNTLMKSQDNLLKSNPHTNFIVAHVGSYSENLKTVGSFLDRYPNMYVDTAERIAELGRQPYSARDFLIKFQDRVLYGTDLIPNAFNTQCNYRFFETRDEYFPYNSLEEHNQGRWNIYGVYLEDEVLKKIYYKNAERLILHLP